MDDIGNPVGNAQWAWLEIHEFPQNFVNFDRNATKTIQNFAKFWNFSGLWNSRLWDPAKTAVVLFGNPEVFGTQFSVVHRGGGGGGGGGWIFSGIAYCWCLPSFIHILIAVVFPDCLLLTLLCLLTWQAVVHFLGILFIRPRLNDIKLRCKHLYFYHIQQMWYHLASNKTCFMKYFSPFWSKIKNILQ